MFGFSNKIKNVEMSTSNNGSRITINGKTFNLPSGTVSICNDKVYVNGKVIEEEIILKAMDTKTINITVMGDCGDINANGDVKVKGDVRGSIDAGGDVTCGNVNGDVDTGGDVVCKNIGGSIDAGGNVRINK